MKICFIATAYSIHTVRWVNSISKRGHNVSLITQHKKNLNSFDDNIDIYILPIKNNLGYYLNYPIAKYYVNKINPDIINVHYASGYGTLSRLINFTPTLLSVWGSDVYDFPYESEIKRKILIKNLKAATEIASTSYVMKVQTKKFIKNKKIHITPFGIDLEKFSSFNINKKPNIINIGIVKKLEVTYGIKYLIKAFKLLLDKLNSGIKIKLIIIGEGSQKRKLKKLAIDLNIEKLTKFVGKVPHNDIPSWLNSFDIFVAPSIRESFGVAVIEASACKLPVIVSDVGGLPEVVDNEKTGYVVPSKNPEAIANKLYELVIDKEKRDIMGKNGRQKVEELYDWENNVDKMEEIYKKMINKYNV